MADMRPAPKSHPVDIKASAGMITHGRRLLMQMVTRLKHARGLRAALRVDPYQPLVGVANYPTRAGLRLLKNLLQIWLWIQLPQRAISPSPRDLPRKQNANDDWRGNGDVLPPKCPRKPLLPRRAGFRANVPLSAKVRLRQPPAKPAAIPQAAMGPTVKITLLPEAHFWLFGEAPLPLAVQDPRPIPSLTDTLQSVKYIRAGQALADLKQIEAILRQPEPALQHLAATFPPPTDDEICIVGDGEIPVSSSPMPPPRLPAPKRLKQVGCDMDVINWMDTARHHIREGPESVPRRLAST